GWYYATYFPLEIFIFVYKGLLLPYPSANLALDLVMLFLYLGIEVTRIFFGSKGNLCQRKVPLSISLALTFPAAVHGRPTTCCCRLTPCDWRPSSMPSCCSSTPSSCSWASSRWPPSPGWTRTKAPSRLFRARQGYALPQRLGPRPHIPSLHSWSDGGPWSRARPATGLVPHPPLLGGKPLLACPATWRETLTRIPDLAPHEAAVPCAQASLTRCQAVRGIGGRGCWELSWIPFWPLQPGLRVCLSPHTQGQVAPGPDHTPMDHACTCCVLPLSRGADIQGPPCKYQ
ncbi:transmembrane protein 216, partial [Chelydra serpentina]